MSSDLPRNLDSLHAAEEELRKKAGHMIAGEPRLQLHLAVTEAAMDLANMLRQFATNDEDLKVVQMLGMRTFNAFGASLKLSLSGITRTVLLFSATSSKPPSCWTYSEATAHSSSGGDLPTKRGA